MMLRYLKYLNFLFILGLCPLFSTDYRQDEAAELQFLLQNKTEKTGLPKSFYVPPGYWEHIESKIDNEENKNERILATYGQNIYDGATWQIALAMMGETEKASEQTDRLLSGKSGNLSLRANNKDFRYGDRQLQMEDGLFFRMISDEWGNADPLTGEIVGWMDWKPILGENAWAALIGPLQVAHFKYKGQIPLDSSEVKLALSILPALKALQSPTGGIYHSTWGVWEKSPHDISTENNASLYAGLVMLKQVLEKTEDTTHLSDVNDLIQGIERYFRDYAYDPELGIISQGGLYNDPKHPNQFVRSPDFAVDVQTWGITVIGPDKIDEWFGKGTAYNIWQKTKELGGDYENGKFKGVGYTHDPSAVLSVEWTLGAILLTRVLDRYEPKDDLKEDASLMREAIEALKEKVTLNGQEAVAFHYADKRYYIPFGWWSNKIPSTTSTAWAMMIDRDFNPFILGGK